MPVVLRVPLSRLNSLHVVETMLASSPAEGDDDDDHVVV